MRTTEGTRDALTGAILVDVSESLRELRCAATERFVKHGVSMTQIHVLRQLEQHGAMSMSRMAELLDVSLSNATGLIDRMVERGLVERVGVPGDRRVVLVRPAPGGKRALEEAEGIKLDWIRTICDRLDDVQLRRMSRSIADLRSAIADEFGRGGTRPLGRHRRQRCPPVGVVRRLTAHDHVTAQEEIDGSVPY